MPPKNSKDFPTLTSDRLVSIPLHHVFIQGRTWLAADDKKPGTFQVHRRGSSLWIRLVGITPGSDDFDMAVDGEDVPKGYVPTFNIQDEVTSPDKERPWYILFQATSVRTSQDILQFNQGGGQRPTTITCLVGSDDAPPLQKKRLKIAVTPCVAPDADAILK
ncbi:hypothetical protein FIBSPDRAFT_970090 [Athelia psychrophila]|uniref:Uncharacterized protein n=1 Tax=Athelia psychrophila TaxID=1759441 RepID=A0A167SXZ8_9AGAM|nr:hypothetical protein FIBSPDRAFT_970090 [Fibularhizoctonia sp. CBS 109695]